MLVVVVVPGSGKSHEAFGRTDQRIEPLAEPDGDDVVPVAMDDQHRCGDAADALVLVYPVFWTEAPAKLVGWFDRVWSYDFGGRSSIVEIYISYLRKKLDALGPPLIHDGGACSSAGACCRGATVDLPSMIVRTWFRKSRW